MQHPLKFNRRTLIIASLLFSIALIIRTVFLNFVPVALSPDEITYVLNAKSIYLTGKDISGTWNPLLLTPVPYEHPQSELIYPVLTPFIGPVPFSLASAHLPGAVFLSALAVIVFLFSRRFLGDVPAGIIGIVAAVNPWGIIFGRTAYDTEFSLVFYYLFIYLTVTAKRWWKLAAIIPLALGFYTYMGFKIIFLPVVLATLVFARSMDRKKSLGEYVAIGLSAVLLLFLFLSTVGLQSTKSRLSEISLYDPSAVVQTVNTLRRQSLSGPLTPFFINKVTVAFRDNLKKYLGAYSPDYLFIDNEATPGHTFLNHGYLYYTDIVFLVIGFCWIFTYNRKLWLYIVSLLLFSPLPSMVSGISLSYAQRSSFMFPPVYICIGAGIYFLCTVSKRRWYTVCVGTLIGIVTGIQLANFLYLYFAVYPVYSAEGMGFSSRVAAHYMKQASQAGRNVTFVSGNPKGMFKNFLFYNDEYVQATVPVVQKAVRENVYTWGTISFITCDDVAVLNRNVTYVYIPGDHCPIFSTTKDAVSINQLKDAGTVYAIINDAVCSPYELHRYPAGLRLNDFSFTHLSTGQFCTSFIFDQREAI